MIRFVCMSRVLGWKKTYAGQLSQGPSLSVDWRADLSVGALYLLLLFYLPQQNSRLVHCMLTYVVLVLLRAFQFLSKHDNSGLSGHVLPTTTHQHTR